jgi:exopolyphosphatase / guanosine-5'-triphosphate,3'-diphosphate pyrophosphatase
MKNKGPIAVIDVGAHFARLEIAQIMSDGRKYETLERLTQIVPLGLDVFTKGKISTTNITLVGKILKDFSVVIKEYKVKHIKTVATSAVREATNRELFIDRVYRISGIRLKVLESSEEAKIMFLALKEVVGEQFAFNKKNVMACVIGTGTTQISFIEKGVLKSSEAIRVGSLRLVEELERPMNARQLKIAIKPFVKTEAIGVLAQSSLNLKKGLMIGMGSSVRTLLKMDASLAQPNAQILSLTKSKFEEIYTRISQLSPTEIAEKYDISETLAQSIEPSCGILYHFLNATNIDNLIIPLVSTRDAIINDLINEISDIEDPFATHLTSCVKTLGEKYRFDSKHAETVAGAALKIFDKTKYLHGLHDESRQLLEISAILHDIGIFINTRQHHKHSYYLIQNSQIPGIVEKEREIIAVTARYHRRAFPKNSHVEYSLLPPEAKVIVTFLAAILRIADALVFAHNLEIVDIKLNYKKQILEIILDGSINLTLDNWTSRKKADLFKEIFGFKTQLTGRQ